MISIIQIPADIFIIFFAECPSAERPSAECPSAECPSAEHPIAEHKIGEQLSVQARIKQASSAEGQIINHFFSFLVWCQVRLN